MLRAQYNFKDRYLMNVAYRRDGSSRFGQNNKWGNFPSVALAWRINQESFLRDAEQVDNLKLRLSYGIIGNQNGIDNYTTLGLAKAMPGEFGDTYYMGYLPGNTLSNPNLKWERSATANVGIDFGFFGNRLSGTAEYYHTRTTDLLVSRSLNAALGYTSMLDNLGETKSQGIDLGITAQLIDRRDLTWSASLNFSRFKNEIVKIDDQVDANGKPMSQPGNAWIIGAPINVYYDYKADGVYQYDDFYIYRDAAGTLRYELKPTVDTNGDGVADAVVERSDVVEPGSVKLRDINGDNKINEEDRVVYNRDPDFTLSLSTNLSWRGFDLYMDWYAVSGGYILNPLLYNGEYGGDLRGKSNGIKVNYWTPSNPTNEFPRPTYGMEIPYLQSMAYQDASYLRLRTLQLGYTLPKKAVKKLHIDKLRFYATATNLLTFTNVWSYSPEVVGSSYPESQQYVFGVNLSF
jgi:TonB-linked SusC/RagA family outer membrane protein